MLKTVNVQEMIEKEVVKFGNGSIVYTPKKWVGRRALVILEKKPDDIASEVVELLRPRLGTIEGVFLFGSRARGEATEGSDIDVLVVSEMKINVGRTERFDFLVKTKEELIREMKSDPTLFIWQALNEAKSILNGPLLEELRKIKPRPDFREFLSDTLGAFKKTREILSEAGKSDVGAGINATIYSLVLRLRTLYLIQCHKKGARFSNRGLTQMIAMHGFSQKIVEDILEAYRAERDERKTGARLPFHEAERLFEAAKIEFIKTERLAKR